MNNLQHIAFIMDGNSTWAKQKNKDSKEGYIAGMRNMIKVVLMCEKIGIKYATFYAFSTENWFRPKEWITNFFDTALNFLDMNDHLSQIEHMKLVLLGDISKLSDKVRNKLFDIVNKTANNTSMKVCLAISYGGRDEIVRACQKIKGPITEEAISAHLDTAGMPDPDLIIRTKSAKRISNFLLWQSAYSEFYFADTLWPDFGQNDFDAAVAEYYERKRTYGR